MTTKFPIVKKKKTANKRKANKQVLVTNVHTHPSHWEIEGHLSCLGLNDETKRSMQETTDNKS